MDQYINNSLNEPLWTLLANPANDAHLYANNLQALVNDFPQSGVLQALLAHASDEKNLRHASVYFNAKSLYKLINAPSAFTAVPDEKIIIQTGIRANGYDQREELQEANVHKQAIEHEVNLPLNVAMTDAHNLIEPAPGIEENTPVEELIENRVTEINEDVPQGFIIPNEHELIHGVTAKEDIPVEATDENPIEGLADAPVVAHIDKLPEQEIENGISDEIFDEIVGIEHINIEPEANQSVAAVPDEEVRVQDEKAEPLTLIDEEEVNVSHEKAEPIAIINNEEEKLITDNTASSDFFMFDRTFGENKSTEQTDNKPVGQLEDEPVEQIENKTLELPANANETTEVNSSVTDDTNHKDVSKYNDEQMPYTFMWWLDKTRKEHAGTYQPYVKSETVNLNDKPKKAADELQQQYFENIFHITSVDELDKSTAPPAVPFDVKRKEHKIIERFIKEEPQIKPQSSDKLDNENKAKKSSEDRDELVTETLAAIYTDQMLYHKAIASYKKLILKFPEKSRYFAGKIEQLEKKTS